MTAGARAPAARPLARRWLIAAGAAAVLGGGASLARYHLLAPAEEGLLLTPEEAYRRVRIDRLLLVDIRRPDEWQRTGLAVGAHPLDLRRPDFAEALAELAGGNRRRPVALICAAGVRSRREAEKLEEAGFTRVYDIPEGMEGSRAGPGWLARRLPIVPWSGG
ncbi:rhodanese-like domain-containing protein [Poseidonocella sp. HB161398]|uniref:rhodanese-like domain-containing protein n=1 Tax=Poseidonocella sp. HB161398 TaxID=2320855 RepID=UPI0011091E28|nr:rhodanese-like domain-containing protein [Poseidonocella sp. HB161398]